MLSGIGLQIGVLLKTGGTSREVGTWAEGTMGDAWAPGGSEITALNNGWHNSVLANYGSAVASTPMGMRYADPTAQGFSGISGNGGAGYDYYADRWLPDRPEATANNDLVSMKAVIQISHAGDSQTVTVACTGIPEPTRSNDSTGTKGGNTCKGTQVVSVGGTSYIIGFAGTSFRVREYRDTASPRVVTAQRVGVTIEKGGYTNILH